MHHDTCRRYCAGIFIAGLAVAVPLAVAAQGLTGQANVGYAGFPVAAGTRLKQVTFAQAGAEVPTNVEAFTITALLQLYPVSPTRAGLPATNGRVDFTYNCFGLVTQQGTTRVKMKDGNAIYSATMQQNTGCNFFTLNLKGRGGKKVSMDTNANVMVSVTPNNPNSPCTPGASTLCLNDGRFKVEMDWRGSAAGPVVSGTAFPTAVDQGLFFFFDPDNVEMLVKVLDGCAVNGHFWVFAGATTNVEFTLQVTDTETGQVKEYSNPLGQAAAAITDTDAFATCP